MNQLTAIDLFAGCGGATQGLVDAGFKVVAAVENDPAAAACYRSNHTGVSLIERDIRSVSDREFRSYVNDEAISLVAGCPPCQGFSRIRTRNAVSSVSDPRNSLYLEVIRVVKLFRPRAVMLENVPHFAIGGRFTRLCTELRRLGYQLTSDVVDVAEFGVPQRRKRLLLMGMIGKKPAFAPPSGNRLTVRDAFGGLDSDWLALDPLHTLPHRASDSVKRRIAAIPKNGGGRAALSDSDTLPCHRRNKGGFNDVYGRMRWDDVAPTITAGVYSPSKGRFLHPEQDRCITLREASILQSFPASYRFSTEHGKMKLASLIGNALPPEFVRRHARALLRQIKGS